MSQTTVEPLSTVQRRKHREFRTPLDGIIQSVAYRFGGQKAKELERFLRFAVVGFLGAFIDLGLLATLQATILPPARAIDSLFNFSYDTLGLNLHVAASPLYFNVALATTLAFVAAVLSNFVWTSLWVYPESRSRTIRRQLSQFFIISVIGWSARTLWITSMYVTLGATFAPALESLIRIVQSNFEATPVMEKRMGSIIAQLIAMVFVMLWNFFANRYWTFNDVE